MQALFTPSSLMFYSSPLSSRSGWPGPALQLAAAAFDPRQTVAAALYEQQRLFTYEQVHSRPEHKLTSLPAFLDTENQATSCVLAGKRDAPKSFLIADILGIEDDSHVTREDSTEGADGERTAGDALSPYSRTGMKRTHNSALRNSSFSSEHLHSRPSDFSPAPSDDSTCANESDSAQRLCADSSGLAGGESKEPRKKKARTTFSGRQIFELERQFEKKKYLSSTERSEMAVLLNVTEQQVKIWFQNRRTKWKKSEGMTNAEVAEYRHDVISIKKTRTTPIKPRVTAPLDQVADVTVCSSDVRHPIADDCCVSIQPVEIEDGRDKTDAEGSGVKVTASSEGSSVKLSSSSKSNSVKISSSSEVGRAKVSNITEVSGEKITDIRDFSYAKAAAVSSVTESKSDDVPDNTEFCGNNSEDSVKVVHSSDVNTPTASVNFSSAHDTQFFIKTLDSLTTTDQHSV